MSDMRPVPFRGKGFAPKPYYLIGIIVFAVFILFLEYAVRSGLISQVAFAAPSTIFMTLVQLFRSGELWVNLAPSLRRLFVGAVLGVVSGVGVGILMGLFTYIRAGLIGLIAALFPIPKIALLPLFIVWFGIDETSKYALLTFGIFTPTVVATYGAVDNVDRTLIRMGQSFNLSWWSIVRKIVLPGALPGILSGLRISLSIGIILLVAAEMIGSEFGIGAYINNAGAYYNLPQLFAGVVILSLFGLIMNWVISIIEKRFLRWR